MAGTGDNGIVYSTSRGRVCPTCGRLPAACTCRKKKSRKPSTTDPADGIVRVRRETKGRRGKGVTTVTGLPGDDATLKKLAGELKKKCGTGGSVKGGIIEIQGDQRDVLVKELEARGYRVKRAGG